MENKKNTIKSLVLTFCFLSGFLNSSYGMDLDKENWKKIRKEFIKKQELTKRGMFLPDSPVSPEKYKKTIKKSAAVNPDLKACMLCKVCFSEISDNENKVFWGLINDNNDKVIHIFCSDCIKQWLLVKNSCPITRQEIKFKRSFKQKLMCLFRALLPTSLAAFLLLGNVDDQGNCSMISVPENMDLFLKLSCSGILLLSYGAFYVLYRNSEKPFPLVQNIENKTRKKVVNKENYILVEIPTRNLDMLKVTEFKTQLDICGYVAKKFPGK
ncbi:hypothetical protein ACFLYH_00135 [Candidatus Dependentiae bacterium]